MVVGCYVGLGLNTEEDCKSWSHMCGSWYLPMLWLRGVLDTDKHSFLYSPGLVVDFPVHNVCPVVALCRCIGEGAFKCSFTLSPKDLPDSPMYELEQCM